MPSLSVFNSNTSCSQGTQGKAGMGSRMKPQNPRGMVNPHHLDTHWSVGEMGSTQGLCRAVPASSRSTPTQASVTAEGAPDPLVQVTDKDVKQLSPGECSGKQRLYQSPGRPDTSTAFPSSSKGVILSTDDQVGQAGPVFPKPTLTGLIFLS